MVKISVYIIHLLVVLIMVTNVYSQEEKRILELSKVKVYFAEKSIPDLNLSVKEDKYIQLTGSVFDGKKTENMDIQFTIDIDDACKRYFVDPNITQNNSPLQFNFLMTFKSLPKSIDFVGMSYGGGSTNNIDMEVVCNYVPKGMKFYWSRPDHGDIYENGGLFSYDNIDANDDFKFFVVIRIGNSNKNYIVAEYHYTKPCDTSSQAIADKSDILGKFTVYQGKGFIKRNNKLLEVNGEAEFIYGDELLLNPDEDPSTPGLARITITQYWEKGKLVKPDKPRTWEMIGQEITYINFKVDQRNTIQKFAGKAWYYISGIPDKENWTYVSTDNMENACKAVIGSRSVFFIESKQVDQLEIKVFEGEVEGTFNNTGEKFSIKEGEDGVLNSTNRSIKKSTFALAGEINTIPSNEIKNTILNNFKIRGVTDLSKINNTPVKTEAVASAVKPQVAQINKNIVTNNPVSGNIINATWITNASAYRGKNGQRFSLKFPSKGVVSNRVWGTDVYTDNSSIASAAVHAGLINAETGGIVTIEISAGLNEYKGSNKNGVNSNNWGAFPGSFTFVK